MVSSIDLVRNTLDTKLLQDIRAPIERARTLPTEAFTHPDFFKFEQEHLLARTWSAVDFGGRIPNVGDTLPIVLYDCPVILIRSHQGKINAFHNVSPYDGCEVVIEPQRALTEIETPYHGWIYDLEGALINASYFDGNPTPKKQPQNMNLVALPCVEWMGTIFLSLNPQVISFDEYLAPVLKNLDNIDLDDLHIGSDKEGNAMIDTLVIKANWKTVFENYAPNIYHENSVHRMYRESDHVPRVNENCNKTYDEITDQAGFIGLSYDNSVGSSFYPSSPFPPVVTSDGKPSNRNTIANMYPNWAITVLNQYARMTLFLPEKVDRCTEMIATYYRGDSAVDPALFDARKVAARGGVIAREEDNIICESIQRARCSPAFDTHPYSPFWDKPHYLLSNLITEKLERALDSVKKNER